ncbi:hypothetical protein, partial [Streptomyces clavuligerus]|uniref:hypothetical protein n=1 Tax=Streptomyces clavuligerus TaxID=1901 RepID=UPI001E499DC6
PVGTRATKTSGTVTVGRRRAGGLRGAGAYGVLTGCVPDAHRLFAGCSPDGGRPGRPGRRGTPPVRARWVVSGPVVRA